MPGSTSTQAAVIDASLAMIRALALTETITSPPTATPVVVFDGPPGGANVPDVFVTIGGVIPAPVTVGSEQWRYLGVQGRTEQYALAGQVYAYVGGDDNLGQSGPSDAQQAARDQAESIMTAIEAGYLANPSLSDQNNGIQLVIWAVVVDVALDQTKPDEPAAAKGRYAQYDFKVGVYNTLTTQQNPG